MLDRDLAELYQVTTGNLNKAVKRNIRRFPPDFMFQLNKEEFEKLKNDLIFQNGISNLSKVCISVRMTSGCKGTNYASSKQVFLTFLYLKSKILKEIFVSLGILLYYCSRKYTIL